MKTKFTIFKNQIIGATKSAKDFTDLLENVMNKKEIKFWSHVQFKDSENRTIQITRRFFEEQNMTFTECVEDWLAHGDIEEEILSI